MLNRLKEKFTKGKKIEAQPEEEKPREEKPGEEKPAANPTKKELKAKKKNEKRAKKGKAPKAQKTPKAKKPKKEKKPKLTKEEKIQKKRALLAAKTKRRVDKIRAKGAKRAAKIQANHERTTEKKRLKKEFNAEKKQFHKSLKDEIKLAKKEVPKSNLPKIVIPVVIVLLLISSAAFMTSRGYGPLAGFEPPEPPGFLKVVASFNPLEKIGSLNPFSGLGSGGASGAEKAVLGMFDSFIALDFAKAGTYIDMTSLVIPEDYIELVGTDAVMNATFERLEYDVVSDLSEISDSEFEVMVAVTAVDYKQLMAGFIREYLRITLDTSTTQTQLGVAGINSLFNQFASTAELDTVSNEITVRVVRDDKSWEVQIDNHLINALFGNAIAVAGNFFLP